MSETKFYQARIHTVWFVLWICCMMIPYWFLLLVSYIVKYVSPSPTIGNIYIGFVVCIFIYNIVRIGRRKVILTDEKISYTQWWPFTRVKEIYLDKIDTIELRMFHTIHIGMTWGERFRINFVAEASQFRDAIEQKMNLRKKNHWL